MSFVHVVVFLCLFSFCLLYLIQIVIVVSREVNEVVSSSDIETLGSDIYMTSYDHISVNVSIASDEAVCDSSHSSVVGHNHKSTTIAATAGGSGGSDVNTDHNNINNNGVIVLSENTNHNNNNCSIGIADVETMETAAL
jgi:hypothetical protein